MTDDSSPATLDISDGIARLTLARPARLNAFTAGMHETVRAALDRIEGDQAVRVVILTGAGRAFCAGQDLRERAATFAAGDTVDLGQSLDRDYNPLVRRLAALPVPVIAAVNGPAAGAGAALAVGCDVVIAARSAMFQFAFARVALGPDSGTSWLLPRLVGPARALALALTADPVSAEEAERIGLAWKVVDDDMLAAEATALAQRFAAGPRAALTTIKRRMRAGLSETLDQALDAERDAQALLGRRPDYREAVTAFAAGRAPDFTGVSRP